MTRIDAPADGDRRLPGAAISKRSQAAWFAVPFAVFALLAVLWALASPIFSVPDENAHATKAIAQARGQLVGYTVPGVRHIVVDLPPEYSYSEDLLCFKWHTERSASCGVELGDASGQDWFNTWVGAYNPVYYALVGWPSLLFDGSAGVYAMRIASALLGAGLLAWAFQAAALGGRARWMPLALAFAAAPMNVYLIGSVNPNGAEIAASVALWVGVLRLLETFRTPPARPVLPRNQLWGGVVIASIVLVNARALGPLWLAIIVATAMIAAGWAPVRTLFTSVSSYPWLGVVAAAGLFSVGWTLWGGSLSGQAEAGDAPLVGASFVEGFAFVVRETAGYLQQAMGVFGWLDTALPGSAYWLLVSAFAVLVVLAVAATSKRSVGLLIGAIAASVLVPALIQGYSVGQTGVIWQGRYGLFLYLGIPLLAGWALSGEARRLDPLAPRVTWIGAGLIAAFGLIAFGVVLVRYVIGGEATIGAMLTAPEWQPPLGWGTLGALYLVASVALVALVGGAAVRISRREAAGEDGPVVVGDDRTPARG